MAETPKHADIINYVDDETKRNIIKAGVMSSASARADKAPIHASGVEVERALRWGWEFGLRSDELELPLELINSMAYAICAENAPDEKYQFFLPQRGHVNDLLFCTIQLTKAAVRDGRLKDMSVEASELEAVGI